MDSYAENEIKKGQTAPDLFGGSKEDSADSVCCYSMLIEIFWRNIGTISPKYCLV